MAKRQIRKHETGYTQVTNIVLNDPKLTWKAKGIYAYIFSKPDAWDFSARRMALEAVDGRDGTLSGIKELEDAGYIRRERQADGRILYHVLVNPNTAKPDGAKGKPQPAKPTEGIAHRGQSRTVSNKEDIVIKSNSNKDTTALGLPIQKVGEYENVRLTEKDRTDLAAQIGDEALADLIEQLSRYIVQQGKDPYKGETHRATIQTWARRRKDELAAKHKTFSLIG